MTSRWLLVAQLLLGVATTAWASEGTTLGIPDALWKLLNLAAFLFNEVNKCITHFLRFATRVVAPSSHISISR